jgi:hypothetical protein
MFSSVETIVKQTELLTFAEQWELLSQLVQRLRQQVLPPATEATSAFSEPWRPSQKWQNTPGLTKVESQNRFPLPAKNPFPPTRVEEVAGCLKYSGPPKTLADMEEAIRVGVLESWHEGN